MGLGRFFKDPIVIASIILVVIAGAILLAVIFYNQKPENVFHAEQNSASQSSAEITVDQENCESDPKPVFTSDITDITKISYLTPPVTVQGGDLKTHGYIHLLHDNSEKVPVYSPTNTKAYEGAFYDVNNSGPLYTIFFEVSCEVIIMFDHIAQPVEKLKKEFSDTPAADSRGQKIGPIEFKAGELIGYVGHTQGSVNWDFGVYNLNEKNPYRDAENEQGTTFRYSNAICPYEYFPTEKRKVYDKLMTDSYGNPYKSSTNLCKT